MLVYTLPFCSRIKYLVICVVDRLVALMFSRPALEFAAQGHLEFDFLCDSFMFVYGFNHFMNKLIPVQKIPAFVENLWHFIDVWF